MRPYLRAVLGLVACLPAPALPLNPIHEGTYGVLPRGKSLASTTFSIAAILDSRDDELWRVPVSLALEAGDRAELGAGLKTQWGEGADRTIPYLVFGGKYRLSPATSLEGDLLLGADRSGDKGFSFTVHHRAGHGRRLFSRLVGKAGFMEAFVRDDALMALEGAWYPTLAPARPLSLELGLIASSQTSDFDAHFALDFQPALLVHTGRESVVATAVALGLAGDNREDLRVKVAVVQGF